MYSLSFFLSLSLLLVLFLLSLVMESFLLMCVTVAGIFFRANENEEVVMHIDIDGGDGGGRERAGAHRHGCVWNVSSQKESTAIVEIVPGDDTTRAFAACTQTRSRAPCAEKVSGSQWVSSRADMLALRRW